MWTFDPVPKAFDKVPHLRLLQKLDHYGIRGATRRWIAQFLQGRDQKVLLNGQHFTSAPVHSGVPQGTVLRPILLLVFINDLPDCVQSPVRLFADDCILYRTIDSPRDAMQMQDDLNNLQKWEDKWLMEFHPEKCLTIRITNKRNSIKTDYQIHGQTLQTVDSANYLGVNIHLASWAGLLTLPQQHARRITPGHFYTGTCDPAPAM